MTTKRLNEQVKRNQERFPGDFAFQLTAEEADSLRSQIATSSSHGGRRYLPFAFTEHGAIMAANVLNSPRAVQMSVFVVRAFLKMRAFLGDKRELAKQLAALEKELKQRLDIHEAAIVTILQRVMISPKARASSSMNVGLNPTALILRSCDSPCWRPGVTFQGFYNELRSSPPHSDDNFQPHPAWARRS